MAEGLNRREGDGDRIRKKVLIKARHLSVNGPERYCVDCQYRVLSTREKSNFIVMYF